MIPQYSAEITTLQHLCINSVFVQDIARVTVVRHVEDKKYWCKRILEQDDQGAVLTGETANLIT